MASSASEVAREDRRIGAILGLAVGDALGVTYEFCDPEEIPEEPLEIVGGGWLNLEPGETTDDTALAKAVLEGYQEGLLDLRRVRYSMLRWEDSDPNDIGNQTSNALDYLRNHPEASSLPDAPSAQGNGAVMRAAPHGVMAESPEQAVENAWAEAALTHPSWEARASSTLVAGLVGCLIEGQSPQEALETSWSLVEARDESGKRVREILHPLERYEHDPGGWTVYTTRLALLNLLEAADFRLGLEKVMRLAGDADSNGAVAGALLGARFGAREIPPDWLRALRKEEELMELISRRKRREYVEEYVVFCLDELEDWGRFGYFLHEADYLLLSLAKDVEDGYLTPTEAFEALKFEALEPYLYDSQASQRGIREKLGRMTEGWSFQDRQKWERILLGGSSGFPAYNDVLEDRPFTSIFEDEADSLAKELDISDVGYFGSSGSTGAIFTIESEEALEELRKAMLGKYKIVVEEDLDDYTPSVPPSLEEAMMFIEQYRGK